MATEGRTGNLTASDKERGTAVYGADEKKIGSIEKVMIGKSNGQQRTATPSKSFGQRR